jgi:hypothetical protein
VIGSIVAEPVGADDVHLGDLPKAGVVVGSSDTVVLLDLDGTILATYTAMKSVGTSVLREFGSNGGRSISSSMSRTVCSCA